MLATVRKESGDQTADPSYKSFKPFKPKHALQLAAPHTWAASVMPVLVSYAVAYHFGADPSFLMSVVLLAICVLMQASVNTFNDYFDFAKGLDTADDMLAEDDSTLVNDDIDPKAALAWAICLLVLAFLLGIYVIIESGWVPLVIALIGAVVVFLYSGGKTPISSLPVGELVSGFVMGGLIPLACVYVLTDGFVRGAWPLGSVASGALVLLWSVPLIIGIGLIMMTNNTCDREKDLASGRKTLPVLCGRAGACRCYHVCLIVWICSIICIVAVFFQPGIIALPFMVLACFPLLKALWKNPLVQASRIGAMGQICSINVALGAFYSLCIFVL